MTAGDLITVALLAIGAAGGARGRGATTFDAAGSVAPAAGDIVWAGGITISGRRGRGTQITRSTGGSRSVRS